MPLSPQDEAFVAFSERTRRTLHGAALLLTGDPARARHLAETVIARRYPPAGTLEEQTAAALAELVRPQPAFFRPPWAREPGLELVDAGPAASRDPLLAELQRLAPEPRASLVLGQYVGLTAAAVAEALRTNEPTVEQWVREAYRALSAGRPERLQPGRLAAELRTVAETNGDDRASEDRAQVLVDLQHGRRLVRGRRVRRGSALVAALLLVVVAATSFLTREAPVPQAGASSAPAAPTPSPTPQVSATCDVRNGVCQATVMREWRTEMARVAASYLDPDGEYFTGYSFRYTPRYESRSFWSGGSGALGLEMFRLKGGATEVYLQVATDDRAAVRCGEITRRRCQSQRFLDGNRFTLTSSTTVEQGMEVQYRPDGKQVVTVAARNTTRGERLRLGRGELLALVQDPRLRLPEI